MTTVLLMVWLWLYLPRFLIFLKKLISSTVDHHSLEYGPSNKNLFQTMGVFHTMGDQKNNFFPIPEIPKYSRVILVPYYAGATLEGGQGGQSPP